MALQPNSPKTSHLPSSETGGNHILWPLKGSITTIRDREGSMIAAYRGPNLYTSSGTAKLSEQTNRWIIEPQKIFENPLQIFKYDSEALDR